MAAKNDDTPEPLTEDEVLASAKGIQRLRVLRDALSEGRAGRLVLVLPGNTVREESLPRHDMIAVLSLLIERSEIFLANMGIEMKGTS